MARNCAYVLILSVLVLLSIGFVILTSVSAFVPNNHGDQYYFITRQLVWLIIATGAAIFASQWDYQKWVKYSYFLIAGWAFLMVLCLAPGIGVTVNNAARWLDLGVMRFQPSEFAKLSYAAFLAYWLGKNYRQTHDIKIGFVMPILVFLGYAILCRLQNDLGTLAVFLFITFLMMFVAGTRWRYLIPLPIIGIAGIIGMALFMPERVGRLLAFMNPEQYLLDEGYQVQQALIAFGSGGVNGLGLGNGVQKMFYLPESHTDFIFPIIGEEMGMVFTLLVVFCFLLIGLSGGFIAWHAKDATGVLLGVGATSLICIQAGFNIAVVTSLVPTKGISLPFISYGGSNLLMCLTCVGILINIHRQAEYEPMRGPRRVLPQVVTVRM
ncbi:MAG: putative lipid II flippase FtsW [Verrucomicrobiota bacterium]